MFSIIVLTHNKSGCTRRCLESLLTSADADWELLVVDNGSTDDTVDLLHEMADKYTEAGREMRLLVNERNAGASTGRNQGIDATTGDPLVFLDNDMVVGDVRWLSKLRATLDSDAKIGMVVPKLVFADDPSMIQFAGGAVSPTGRVQFMGRGEPADDPRFNERRELQFGISACMMLRRSLVDEIGTLDEAFNPVQFEDVDYCYRARSKGYTVVYEPAVTMLHDESATTAASDDFNNRYIVIKHGMLFKARWRHMFETENGPPDDEIHWKPIGRFARRKPADREQS
ncbi:MAG TPA: glycosyltransferase family 2 protein [Planctomycetota bacterium]|nr:glycosyltransferase family 2 protein [Planctomycetota bacterium]